MKKNIIILFVISSIISACISTQQLSPLSQEDIQYLPTSFEATTFNSKNPCRQWYGYVPDTNHLDHMPMRFVRVNFHWMNTSDSLYTPGEFRATEFSRNLLRAANQDLSRNHKLLLPYKNDLPVLPTQYRYVLTPDKSKPGDRGIYFHYDDEFVHYVHKGKNRNIHKRGMFKKYAVQPDSVLNIFVFAHHPDSLASSTCGNYIAGCALGDFVKLVGVYCNYKSTEDYWGHRGNFNHEIGHIYGLRHAWLSNDGCNDTPVHKQDCFNSSQSAHCDTSTSNNVMDYVAVQHAWSPCQIGRVHARMSNLKSRQRKFLIPSWCTFKDSMSITIQDTIIWQGAKDLEGDLTIASGASLSINCRVSMPPGGKIIVQAGGTLILNDAYIHNDCGKEWSGIEIEESQNEKGQVIFTGEPQLENMTYQIE